MSNVSFSKFVFIYQLCLVKTFKYGNDYIYDREKDQCHRVHARKISSQISKCKIKIFEVITVVSVN